MDVEIWRPIPGWQGYEVSNHGAVRSWKFCRRSPGDVLPRPLQSCALPNGYLQVTLKDRGIRANRYLHRLVMEAFHGPPPIGMEVAHNDGDQCNNHLDNLRYATPIDNCADTERHGHRVRGAKQHMARLTEAEAVALLTHPGSHSDAAKACGVSYHLAYCLRTGRTWKHLRSSS